MLRRGLLLLLWVAGCGGDPTAGMMQVAQGQDAGGLLAVGVECPSNEACESGLCTKEPYDRKPNPVCTYRCDPTMPHPKCTAGCNMKGYCKLP